MAVETGLDLVDGFLRPVDKDPAHGARHRHRNLHKT
jgi:hypothetical protein